MFGAGFDNTYEDDLYRDNADESGSSSDIDSDTEEKILSHLYYQSEAKATAAAPSKTNGHAADHSKDCNNNDEDENDEAESKYQAHANGSKRRSQTSGAQTTDQVQFAVTGVPPFRSATNSESDSDGSPAKSTLAFNTEDDSVDNYLDSVSATGQATPHGLTAVGGETMERKLIQVATLLGRDESTAENTVKDNDDMDENFDYLEEAKFQGKNRYFLEEEEIICHKCHKPGHTAKNCDTITCMVCGKEGHLAKDCHLSGSVCYRCNMRGHIAADCPLQSGGHGSRYSCKRCYSRNHHSEECPTIWRHYTYTYPPPKKYNSVTPFCYNCAIEGHFGDDCTRP
ncbi:hypothetical protein FBU59_003403, partial [Linderina macrospora]